jgi:hypothetical protein
MKYKRPELRCDIVEGILFLECIILQNKYAFKSIIVY